MPAPYPSRRGVTLGLVTSAVGACATRAGSDAGLDQFLNEAVAAKRAEHTLPGLTVGVWKHGELLARATSGVRALGRNTQAGANDQWHIGSCTKFMTACMMARLVVKGFLRWEDALATALPPSMRPYVHPSLQGARIDQLLHHTSGIVDPPETIGRSPIPPELTQLFSDQLNADIRSAQQGALLALREAPWRPPGEAFRYSNWAFIAAGVIASQATGKPFSQLMHEEVFEPLGVQHTGFGPPGAGESLGQPWGHIAEELEGVPLAPGPVAPGSPFADFPRYVSPAGLLHLPIMQWGRFLQMVLEGFSGRSSYLPREQFSKLFTTLAEEDANVVAMGIKVYRSPDGVVRMLTHSGSNLLWRADYRVFPVTGRIFAMASNTGAEGAQTAFDEISDMLIRELSRREGRTYFP